MPTNVTLIWLVTLALFVSQAHADEGQFKDLGPQITSTLIQGTTFTKDASGNPLVCTVIRGQPAKLLVYNVRDGKLLERLTLKDANGAWNACTATDNSVYVSTDDKGHLYRWIPGEDDVKDLGQVAPLQMFAWDVRPGVDGEVFVGTYPGCLLLRYHPKDGFSDIGHGAVAPGENYARSVSYDPASGKIYVGVGSHAHLIEIDRKTGQKNDILPKEFKDHEFCYTVNFAGGKLFALPTNPPHGNVENPTPAIVMNPSTLEIEAKLTGVQPQMVMSPVSPDGEKIYFNSAGKLAAYDFKSKTDQVVNDQNMSILGMTWLDDGRLAILIRSGRLIFFDPKSRETTNLALEIPPEPTPIQSIRLGPDGRMYTGGYLSGGLGAYDPATGKHEQYRPISQPEGMTVLGDRLYLGIYPHARLTWFDTTKPWNPKEENPHQFDHLDRVEQDRPIGVVGVKSLNKVFFGTVPDYGKLGGLLAVVDGSTDQVTTYRNIIPDQSIINLIYTDGLIVGGTSIAGGLGIEPKAKESKLFLWDPAANKVIFETAPVAGSTLTTGLMVGPDKNIWGIGDGTLFIFDLKNRKVIFTKKLFDVEVKDRHANWRDAYLVLHPSGQIYDTMGVKFFRLDPSTKDITILRTLPEHEAAMLTMDRNGVLYFREKSHLMTYTP